MPTVRTIRSRDGTRKVKLNPLKAIREKCLDCSGWISGDVEGCDFEDCPLWQLRFQKKGDTGLRPLKQVRLFCLWCQDGHESYVRECPSELCALWVYRMGRNPALSGRDTRRATAAKMKRLTMESETNS